MVNSIKLLTVAAILSVLFAGFATADEIQQDRPNRTRRGPRGVQTERFDREEMMRHRSEMFLRMLERSDPDKAADLQELLDDNPESFRKKMTEIMQQRREAKPERVEPMRHRGRTPRLTREQLDRLLERIERRSPERAAELYELREESPREFRQQIRGIWNRIHTPRRRPVTSERVESFLERLDEQSPERAERLRRYYEDNPEQFKQRMGYMFQRRLQAPQRRWRSDDERPESTRTRRRGSRRGRETNKQND